MGKEIDLSRCTIGQLLSLVADISDPKLIEAVEEELETRSGYDALLFLAVISEDHDRKMRALGRLLSSDTPFCVLIRLHDLMSSDDSNFEHLQLGMVNNPCIELSFLTMIAALGTSEKVRNAAAAKLREPLWERVRSICEIEE